MKTSKSNSFRIVRANRWVDWEMGAFDGRGISMYRQPFGRCGVAWRNRDRRDGSLAQSLCLGACLFRCFRSDRTFTFPASLSCQFDLPCFTTLSVYLVRLCLTWFLCRSNYHSRRRTHLQFTALQRLSIAHRPYSLTQELPPFHEPTEMGCHPPHSRSFPSCIDKHTHYTQSTPSHHQSLPPLIRPTPPALSSPPAHPYPSVHPIPSHSILSHPSLLEAQHRPPLSSRPLSLGLDAHPNPIPRAPTIRYSHIHTSLPPSFFSPYHTVHPSPSSNPPQHFTLVDITRRQRDAPPAPMS